MNFLKMFRAREGVKMGDYGKMYPASDVLTLLNIVCRNTDKIYEEFWLDLRYYFSTVHLVIDLILKISSEKIGLTPSWISTNS